jgi:hypothetical protein
MAVWSLKRGVIEPPEPLDGASSQLSSQSFSGDTTVDYHCSLSCIEPRHAECVDPLDLDLMLKGRGSDQFEAALGATDSSWLDTLSSHSHTASNAPICRARRQRPHKSACLIRSLNTHETRNERGLRVFTGDYKFMVDAWFSR